MKKYLKLALCCMMVAAMAIMAGCGGSSGITGVLNLERVGQSSVFSNRNRADRLGDCKNWSGDNTDGFFCGDGSDSSALCSDDICDC